MSHNNPKGTDLQRYADFRPTGFDCKGLGAESMGDDENDADRSAWLIVPVSRNRDSGTLDQSNFATAEAMLEKIDPDGRDHENHRFGHWGHGWFELLIVRPETKCATEAEEIGDSLASHPVLSDDDYSRRECEAEDEGWVSFGRSDMRRALAKLAGLESDALDEVEDEALRACVECESSDEGPRFHIGYHRETGEKVTADTVRALPGIVLE